MTKEKEVCALVADLIERRGWYQIKEGLLIEEGTICALDAIARAANFLGGEKDYPLKFSTVNFFRDVIKSDSIGSWNDKPGRTKEEVIATLRKASQENPQ